MSRRRHGCYCQSHGIPHCPVVHGCSAPVYWQPLPHARALRVARNEAVALMAGLWSSVRRALAGPGEGE